MGFQQFFIITTGTLSDEVCLLVANVVASGNFNTYLVDTLIVPIPKNDNPTTLKEFSPINLCNVILKIVLKCWSTGSNPSWITLSALYKVVLFLEKVLVIMPSLLRKLSTICTRRKVIEIFDFQN